MNAVQVNSGEKTSDPTKMSSAAYHFAKYGKHRQLTPEQTAKRKRTKAQGKARKLNRK